MMQLASSLSCRMQKGMINPMLACNAANQRSNASCTVVIMQDAEMEDKLQVYNEVMLECTAPWIDAPKALILPHNGRNFEIKASVIRYNLCPV